LIKVKFIVHVSEGYLYAEGQGIGIYISDKTWDALVKDIIETVELCYNLPPKTEFKLVMETKLRCFE
jgi:hypothetical protein